MKSINPELLELSKEHIVIYNGLVMHERGDMTYSEALEQIIISLAEHNKVLRNELTRQILIKGAAK